MLPPVKKVKMQRMTFPTLWQTVIFRNYGYVKTESITRVLGCDGETVRFEAKRLGLPEFDFSADFESRGYITVIRNNWFLLPYEQLTALLGIDESRLDFILENDDFLGVKLGNFKPFCEKVAYSPLRCEQIAETERIAAEITELSADDIAKPFAFFENDSEVIKTVTSPQGKRIVHGYLSPCGDAFSSDCSDTLPESIFTHCCFQAIQSIFR